ncbi:MAG: SDR family oxidoreductase [Bacteroidetes bacterium]|nr:SDR family oxidoreductase [Bacteroidota bacterium]
METKKARVVWITGASAGIGKALALKFASNNDIVIASARTEEKLNELQHRISDSKGTCSVVPCDVQSETSVIEAYKKVTEEHSGIDILINNAGVTYFENFIETTTEQFDHTINTNLRGTFLTTKAVLQSMLKNGKGSVLNIVSYIVKEVYTKSAAYAASKAGVEAMMNVLRAEVRGQGVNIVNVFPGAVNTQIWHPKQLQKYGNQMLTPEQVADMVYDISVQPHSLMVEEIILRPQGGNLQVSP